MIDNLSKWAQRITTLFIALIIGFWFYWNSDSDHIMIVIPNEYEGYITIIEDRNNFDLYYPKALETSDVLEYYVGNDKVLRVQSIKPFLNWPNHIRVSYEWVEPLVYFQGSMHPQWNVYGDLNKVSTDTYQFWTGPRNHLSLQTPRSHTRTE